MAKNDPLRTLMVLIRDSQHTTLKRTAWRNQRSMAEEVRQALDAWLDRSTPKQEPNNQTAA